ncbi:HU family DNA-binding protein [uncultured Desulfovibrio sp.]|uniref:HU family DNA-binding protein n=1 Tax=uncultured Desulfovibrio sp. TaxID=167968 RepID=UPI002617F827|nr:HU family DNA-binding protein [uncultured Desulfovibrio sp.]
MTRQELIKAVTQAVRTAHPDRDVNTVMVEVMLEALGDVAAAELLGGGEIPLPGLGKLKSKDIAARTGRNPRTGETLDIPAHKAVTFAACKDLKEAMKP